MTPQTVSLSSLEPGWVTRARQWIAMATASGNCPSWIVFLIARAALCLCAN
jgi:hypothetical protein